MDIIGIIISICMFTLGVSAVFLSIKESKDNSAKRKLSFLQAALFCAVIAVPLFPKEWVSLSHIGSLLSNAWLVFYGCCIALHWFAFAKAALKEKECANVLYLIDSVSYCVTGAFSMYLPLIVLSLLLLATAAVSLRHTKKEVLAASN